MQWIEKANAFVAWKVTVAGIPNLKVEPFRRLLGVEVVEKVSALAELTLKPGHVIRTLSVLLSAMPKMVYMGISDVELQPEIKIGGILAESNEIFHLHVVVKERLFLAVYVNSYKAGASFSKTTGDVEK